METFGSVNRIAKTQLNVFFLHPCLNPKVKNEKLLGRVFRFVFFFFPSKTARWIHMIQFLNCLLSPTPNKPGQPSTIRKIFVFHFQPLKDVGWEPGKGKGKGKG